MKWFIHIVYKLYKTQPIVENAIYHGMGQALYEVSIKINSKIENDCLIIFVSDNGVGMTANSIDKVLSTPNITGISKSKSIMLLNVLKLYLEINME